MCNQCNDIRRIHQGSVVYGVFHNGRMTMAFPTEVQAIKVRGFMQNGGPCECKDEDTCIWEVFEVDRKATSWET